MKIHAFYNIACMGHWREVVLEQFRVLSRAGFKETLNITFLGCMKDFEFVREMAFFLDINIELIHQECNLMQFEFPSIRAIQAVARSRKGQEPEAVVHFHTKGVSRPGDPGIHWWRWIMNAYVLNRWKDAIEHLQDHDAAGVAWNSSPSPHFCGNFWWARTDWLAKLDDIDEYRDHRYHGWVDRRGGGFARRFAVELWLSQNVEDDAKPRIMSYVNRDISAWDANWWDSHEGRDFKIIAYEEGSGGA